VLQHVAQDESHADGREGHDERETGHDGEAACSRMSKRIDAKKFSAQKFFARWLDQGCHIFLGTTYQNGKKYTKYPPCPQNIPNGCNIDQMVTKYTNVSHCKTLQNLSKLEFLARIYAIWQSCAKRADKLSASISRLVHFCTRSPV
jgi:hypothetical protein